MTGLTDAVDVCAGVDFSCAVRATGRVVCWGENSQGQLGIGMASTVPSASPQPVRTIANAAEVVCGGFHACARLEPSGLLCWGFNAGGQLGNGTNEDSADPVAPMFSSAASPVTHVAVGVLHTCAIVESGTTWCWGDGVEGQLGNGTLDRVNRPVQVSTLTGAAAIESSSSAVHTCALVAGGAAQCWGYNSDARLGDGTSVGPRTRPVEVRALIGASGLAVGATHSCAFGATQTWCWGSGERGALGDGAMFERSTYVLASGVPALIGLSAGGRFTCGIAADHRLWCWGSNEYGQLGDGTTTDRLLPAVVPSPE